MIALTFALRSESSGVIDLLRNCTTERSNGVAILRGEIEGRPLAILHTGVGIKVCRERLEPFLARHQCGCLISAGFAGGVEAEIKVGDLFLAENFSDPELLRNAAS